MKQAAPRKRRKAATSGADDSGFPTLDSLPHRALSLLSGLTALFFACVWGALAAGSLWLLFQPQEPLPLRLCLVAITSGGPAVLYAFFRSSEPAYDAIRVDASGLAFSDRGNVIRRLHWRDLAKNPGTGYDVGVETVGAYVWHVRASHEVLRIWVRSADGPRAERLYFRGTRTFRSVFANAGELRAHFLRGVATFRSRLTIDSRARSVFCIDRDSGAYDRRARILTNAVGLIIAVIVIALVLIFVG